MKRISYKEDLKNVIIFIKYNCDNYLHASNIIAFINLAIFAIASILNNFIGNNFLSYLSKYSGFATVLSFLSSAILINKYNNHKMNVDRLFFDIDVNYSYSDITQNVELVPINVDFNLEIDNLKKIFKDGAFMIFRTYDKQYIIKSCDEELFLIEQEDVDELNLLEDNVKKLILMNKNNTPI